VQTFAINPGLFQTFPWLSSIANQYEQWTPNGIVFEFKSTSSDYTATSALGSVIMCTDYDQLDVPFANKQEMLNSAYCNEAKPTEHIVHGLECAPQDTPNRIFYTRTGGAVQTLAELRDTDLAQFSIATQGGTAANLNLGSLYVYYDITLRKEQLFGGVLNKGNLFSSYQSVTGNGADATNPFGTIDAPITSTNMLRASSTVQLIKNNTIQFNKAYTGARFLIVYRVFGTVGPTTAPIWTGSNGATVLLPLLTDTNATADGFLTQVAFVDIGNFASSLPPTITATGGTYPAGITGFNLIVTQVNINQSYGYA
jgi:hypothetical protein